ncbi:pyridine nucleotide-disulfide oxidoreductase-domain-containing protein [Podospora appendiculata]|uniref:Pyridine nucleotide-disulfide oxidoreductase-domain-containing protein n=1 Tax=Podospora appendiculata TaxID=314037 RepID=A0AAE1CF50_9PEZI|nr:pyridine nucleotide-disulfide oxidoreductase-domain-containing protein [Podospora appendiculata]
MSKLYKPLPLTRRVRRPTSGIRCFSARLEAHDRKKERVVILGSGWAGYAFARTLDPAKYERVVISPRSYFVFTPLLASTTVGTLETRTILEPVRRLRNIGFLQGWADDVDFSTKTVRVESNVTDNPASKTVVPADPDHPLAAAPRTKGEMFDISYDKLVIACGAYSQTFNIEGVREHAHFLRDIGDARRIRLRVLSLFEQCAYLTNAGCLTDDDKRTLLHFAIVGGGPTGIEFAAELHDLVYEDLARIYPDLVKFVRITVYDVAPKVLPMFDQALSKYATDTFARQGINVKTRHHLERLRRADGHLGSQHGALRIKIREHGDEEVGAGLVVWSTGLMANPLVQKLAGKEFAIPAAPETAAGKSHALWQLTKDAKTGDLVTDSYLRAQTHTSNRDRKPGFLPNVFIIGDCGATMLGDDRSALPKTAQVASQQATYLAKYLNKAYSSSSSNSSSNAAAKPFEFRNWGTMTYLGSWKAIHQSAASRELKGWMAWVLWRGAYLTKSMSLKNKILVPVYWVISWSFGRDINRF